MRRSAGSTGSRSHSRFRQGARRPKTKSSGNSVSRAARESPADAFGNKEQRAIIKRVLETTLTEREVLVLTLRFGLDGEEPRTLEEVGRVLGVTREGARQIEQKALWRLRRSLRSGQRLPFFLG